MFRRQSSGGVSNGSSNAGTAKRVISSILETSGFVCGSLKDTVQDKLDENDIDMKWVEGEIDNIKTKLGPTIEKPREKILNFAEKACRGGSEPPSSPTTAPGMVSGGSFLDDSATMDVTFDGTATSADGRALSVNTGEFDDETTMASTLMSVETNKKNSRFAQVVHDAKKYEKKAADKAAAQLAAGGGTVVIGLCLSRQNPTLGHPATVTRQNAFDFNELQDRDYKYVSSTDNSGWLAGGGERGDPYLSQKEFDQTGSVISSKSEDSGAGHKIASPDRVHIPIIQINAASSAVIDEIVAALARGEIFIPEVSILPESLSINATSPPDLVVRFGCEKNDDTSPEDWSNWCLEFLHNQLYDYFAPMGAQWSKRPFQITLARKVRWMTVKHMNKYFARSEQVINSWREKGPQYLQPPYSDDSSRGVILEEITRPHGIYLIRNGVPTNYFAPNFQPPYTTKMRRSLIRNVINKSWDIKHRDWLSEPVPRMRGPVQFITSAMGCANPNHLSPVNENSNVTVFHIGQDFDLVAESKDEESSQREESRSRKSDKKQNAAKPIDKQKQQKDSQHHHHHQEEREKELDVKPTSSMPSDEPYGHGAKSEQMTMSCSLEETMIDSENDPITVNGTISNSLESPGRSNQWSENLSPDTRVSQESMNKKNFFNSEGNGRTPSFESSKGVSFSESSIIESERVLDHEQERQQRSLVSQKVKTFESSSPKENDIKVDKFGRAKTKRREMKDRRQDPPSSSMQSSATSPSGESMAYSLDSASYFRPPIANTNAHDGSGSVMTTGTENQSLLSYVTRSTMVQSRFQEDEVGKFRSQEDDDSEDSDISLSLLESKSVPADDELNAAGWAKALDPNSGSYYYFTLDRTKTIWENPLVISP